MKKFKILSFAVLPMLFAALAGCKGGSEPSSSSKSETTSSTPAPKSSTTTPAPSSTSVDPTPSSSSIIPPSPSSSSEAPSVDAYVSVDGLTLEMEPDSVIPEGSLAAFHVDLVDLVGGEDILFTYLGTPIYSNIGSDPEDEQNKNNAVVEQGESVSISVHNGAEDASIYLKVWQDGFSFWITGYQESPKPEEKALLKMFKGEDPAVDTELLPGVNPGEYHVLDFEADADARYKFNLGERWDGIANFKDVVSNYVEASGESGDFAFKDAGKYDIYWDTTVEGETPKSIWVEKEYLGEIKFDGQVVDHATLGFHKIEGNVVEYSITEAPLSTGCSVSISFNNEIKPVIVEEAGDYLDFDITETTLTLKEGTNVKYDFYLKDDTVNGTLTVYVEKSKEPVEGASVEIGKITATMIEDTDATGEGLVKAYKLETPIEAVNKDDVVVFTVDGSAVTSRIGSEPEDEKNHNNAVVSGEETVTIVIHNDASNVEVYLKVWQDGGHSFWITGYEPDPVLPPVLMLFNEENPTGLPIDLQETSEGSGEYYVLLTVESSSDHYKFKNGDIWHGIDNVKDGISYYVTKSGEQGDFAFKEVGTYKVYWDTKVEGETPKSIWIQKRFFGEVRVGGQVVQKASFDFHKVGEKVLEYKILEAPLSAGVSVSVSFNNVVKSITVEEAGAYEDFTITETSLTLKAGTNVEYDFYLKESTETGALSIYVAKTPAAATFTANLSTSIGGLDIWSDGAVLFVYIIDNQSWVEVTKVSDTQITFVATDALAQFIVVRCSSGTTKDNVDWSRKWNQSEDISTTAGVFTYDVDICK